MDPFSIAMLALTALPKLVDAFESLFSTKKKAGPKKKKLLLETTKTGLQLAGVPEHRQIEILAATSALTDMVVSELNSAEHKDAK